MGEKWIKQAKGTESTCAEAGERSVFPHDSFTFSSSPRSESGGVSPGVEESTVVVFPRTGYWAPNGWRPDIACT